MQEDVPRAGREKRVSLPMRFKQQQQLLHRQLRWLDEETGSVVSEPASMEDAVKAALKKSWLSRSRSCGHLGQPPDEAPSHSPSPRVKIVRARTSLTGTGLSIDEGATPARPDKRANLPGTGLGIDRLPTPVRSDKRASLPGTGLGVDRLPTPVRSDKRASLPGTGLGIKRPPTPVRSGKRASLPGTGLGIKQLPTPVRSDKGASLPGTELGVHERAAPSPRARRLSSPLLQPTVGPTSQPTSPPRTSQTSSCLSIPSHVGSLGAEHLHADHAPACWPCTSLLEEPLPLTPSFSARSKSQLQSLREGEGARPASQAPPLPALQGREQTKDGEVEEGRDHATASICSAAMASDISDKAASALWGLGSAGARGFLPSRAPNFGIVIARSLCPV